MRVNQIIEQPDGTSIQFTGELKGRELEAVITVGLNYLLQKGVFVPELRDEEEPPSDEHMHLN